MINDIFKKFSESELLTDNGLFGVFKYFFIVYCTTSFIFTCLF